MKNILITGANSYIGMSFENYIKQWPNEYRIDTLDTRNLKPTQDIFSGYDVVFHVAGIAHIKENKENTHLYFEINRDLTIELAQAAKRSGVKQFVTLSSMSVYGKVKGHIKKDTVPNPTNAYGKSKLEADNVLLADNDDKFKVTILRPPMVYGKGCRGNYQQLRNFAIKAPIFPWYENQRSMLYIGNLCKFVKDIVDSGKSGVFFPQNAEYVCTSEMVKLIAQQNQKKIIFTKIFNPFIKMLPLHVLRKVFGNLTYEKTDTVDEIGFEESIELSEM